jgi:peptidoglycan/LPS O-acetylase OafA/YrhL
MPTSVLGSARTSLLVSSRGIGEILNNACGFGPRLQIGGGVARPQAFKEKASAFLGNLSYPLYAIHMPLIFLGSGLAPAPGDRSAPVSLGLIAIANGAAVVLSSVYDRTARRLLSAISERNLAPRRHPPHGQTEGVSLRSDYSK